MADKTAKPAAKPEPPKDSPLLLKLMRTGLREDFARKAIDEKGLTEEDITWNERFGRPINFKETVEPDVEVARRAAWTRLYG